MKITQITSFIVALFIATNLFAQTTEGDEKPYIEVTGTAEQEIVPDEIYINITIKERYTNREKITIESQEEKLKASLKEIGINLSNLYLSDANADFVRVKLLAKDVLTKKDYTLKVSTAATVGLVFQQLEKLEINDAYVAKVNHTKMDSLRKEVKIMAIKAAKNKADYLLAAIGEQTGKALVVEDRENRNNATNSYVNTRGARASATAYYIDGVRVSNKEEELQFKMIKIEAQIYVKFAIKQF